MDIMNNRENKWLLNMPSAYVHVLYSLDIPDQSGVRKKSGLSRNMDTKE